MPTRRRRMPKPRLEPRPSLEPKPLEKGPIRKMAEGAAVATYTALKPSVDKVKGAVVKGLDTYLSVVDKGAEKIKPYAEKAAKALDPYLPDVPQRHRGRGRRRP